MRAIQTSGGAFTSIYINKCICVCAIYYITSPDLSLWANVSFLVLSHSLCIPYQYLRFAGKEDVFVGEVGALFSLIEIHRYMPLTFHPYTTTTATTYAIFLIRSSIPCVIRSRMGAPGSYRARHVFVLFSIYFRWILYDFLRLYTLKLFGCAFFLSLYEVLAVFFV